MVTLSGAPFPDRDLIVFLTFCVILVTLVGQGLTLPLLIHLLGLREEGDAWQEEVRARRRTAEAARARLEMLAREPWAPPEVVEQLRARYKHSAQHATDARGAADRQQHAGERRLHREVLDAQRREALRLRDEGAINDDVLQRIQRDLDLEDLRLGPET